jgi:hypothetical protein
MKKVIKPNSACSALMYAARSNAPQVMDILLNRGVDSKSRSEALYFAALDGRMEAVCSRRQIQAVAAGSKNHG